MIKEWRGVLHTLIGFESNKAGTDSRFNLILSNGDKTTHRDGMSNFRHMVPAGSLKQIRSAKIYYNHYNGYIRGFSFFDKDSALLWKIGHTDFRF